MQHFTPIENPSNAHFYGLDVHQDSICISFAQSYGEPIFIKHLANSPQDIDLFFDEHQVPGATVFTVYEAGGCGFHLHRHLEKRGITNLVAAPSKIIKVSGEIKNDKRDSLKLTKLLRNHILTGGKELHEVFVPEESAEAMQEVTRLRDFYKRQVKRTQNKILALLRKYGFRYNQTKTRWGKTHRIWLEKVQFGSLIKQTVYRNLLNTLYEQEARVVAWDKELDSFCDQWNQNRVVKALCTLKGIQILTASTIVAEVGEFSRFKHPKRLMAYLGLVPSEYSSGKSVTRGRITKAGNKRVRTLLIESSHAAGRLVKSKKAFLDTCPKDLPEEVLEHAYKAQIRLNKTYYRLLNSGKNSCVAKVAVARELAGFVWAIAVMIECLDSKKQPMGNPSTPKKSVA